MNRARFAQQLEPCDILILDAELMRAAGALEWFGEVQPLPIALLSDDDTDFLARRWSKGRRTGCRAILALQHPELLAAVLRRAALTGELSRLLNDANAALADSRRQVNRLVDRLWEVVPTEKGANCSDACCHMLERLQEEMGVGQAARGFADRGAGRAASRGERRRGDGR